MTRNKIINLVVILAILISLSLSAYLFFFRKENITKDTIKYDRVLLEDVNNIEAEKLNYDKVDKPFSTIELEEYYYNFNNEKSFSGLKRLVNVKSNSLEFKTQDLKTYIPIIYSLDYEDFDPTILAENIKLLITSNNLTSIFLDSSLQSNLENYYSLISLLNSSKTFKIGLLLTPRTAELEDYSGYKVINKNITKIVDINRIKDLADSFYLETYDYTPANAALPGPGSKLTEIEDVIQYYIYKGLPRDKIYIGINKIALSWQDRLFEENINKNVIVDSQQAEIYSGNIEDLKDVEFSNVTDSFGFYTEGTTKYLVVFTSNDYELKIKTLAKNYGIKGVFYRN